MDWRCTRADLETPNASDVSTDAATAPLGARSSGGGTSPDRRAARFRRFAFRPLQRVPRPNLGVVLSAEQTKGEALEVTLDWFPFPIFESLRRLLRTKAEEQFESVGCTNIDRASACPTVQKCSIWCWPSALRARVYG